MGRSFDTGGAAPTVEAEDIPASTPHDRYVIVKKRHWVRYGTTVVLALLLVWAGQSIATNKAFEWNLVGDYLFSEPILDGLLVTLKLTLICMVIACALGTVIALMRTSNNPLLVGISWTYSWVFRATPLLVQLLFWFNLGALYHQLSIGIPFGPTFASVASNQIMTALSASILGLSLHEAANMAEIIRSGIGAVGSGQIDAAAALGMTPLAAMRFVVLPQALRVIVPPTGSQILSMLKMTTLVSVLALGDLLFAAQSIYSRIFKPIPLLLVAVLWYLLLTSVLMVAQHFLERWLGRSDARRVPTSV